MKLIRCKECDDVVRLVHTEWRKCDCGNSGGQYNEDLLSATVGGECEVIGIRNDFFTKSKKERTKDGVNCIIQGEYLGDNQIFRIESSKGPKLRIEIEEIDEKTNNIIITDKRKYTINLKGNKSPKSIKVPSNKQSSFKDSKTINENTCFKQKISDALKGLK